MDRRFVTVNANEGQVNTPRSNAAAEIPQPEPPRKDIHKNIVARNYALNGATADFAVICEDQRFMAHKAVLVAASPYFARMLRFQGKETGENQVVIQEINHHLLKWTLDFIYTGCYSLPGGDLVPSTGYCNHNRASILVGPPASPRIFKHKCAVAGKFVHPSHLLPHVRIYAIADYMHMGDLKTFARQCVMDVLHVYWSDEELEWVDALDEAFSNTPAEDRGLRQVLVDCLKAHPGVWVDDGDVGFFLDDNFDILDEVDAN